MNSLTTVEARSLRPIYWRDGVVALLDQTRLPQTEVWLELSDYREVVSAIQEMRIRGAPAIGVAGAYAVALAARELAASDSKDCLSRLEQEAASIRSARPTGANLGWAVTRMMGVARGATSPDTAVRELIAEAIRIQEQDEQANRAIGRLGSELLSPGSSVLTHCNAGALATGGYGTALGVIQTAWTAGRLLRVFATETRPLFQGARLTAWELARAGINATVLPDSAAGQLIRAGRVQAVVVGADRIAANGDVANKIGTYSLAVLSRESSVPFYVAAPTSTVDLRIPSGDSIPIEQRSSEEVSHVRGARVVPDRIEVLNPAFDVTPRSFIAAIITENGVVREPFEEGLAEVVEGAGG